MCEAWHNSHHSRGNGLTGSWQTARVMQAIVAITRIAPH
jgi:hypothetical protein